MFGMPSAPRRGSDSGFKHEHAWNKIGYCAKVGCGWRQLRSGVRVKPVKANTPCACDCGHPEAEKQDKPRASWRVEYLYRSGAAYPGHSSRPLCSLCYNDQRHAEGRSFASFIRESSAGGT